MPAPASREMVRVLAALSDENRYRIVELLSGVGELSCGDIGRALDLSPSLLSHHLSILEDARVVERRRRGLWTLNRLRRDELERHVHRLRNLVGLETPKSGGTGELPGPTPIPAT